MAEGHELPRGVCGLFFFRQKPCGRGCPGLCPPEFFWNEYMLECSLVHFETQFWEMLVSALTSSRLDDISDIVTYTVMITIYIYIVIITVYVTISEISSRRDEVSADTNISQNCVSKCTKLHSSIYSFQKNSGGHNPGQPRPQGFCLKKKSPQTPLGSSWPSATLDFSP